MSEHFKFFQNNKCEYFPCHKSKFFEKHKAKFNCLFCYCPLYLIEDCGGNWIKINGIKDCTECIFPHIDKNYTLVLNKLKEHVFDKKN